MDPVTHTLCGLSLARAGGDRLGRVGTATLVIAANLPDIDILGAPLGRAWYLIHHRGITHALVGLATLSVLLAGGMWAVSRRQAEPATFRSLWGLAAIGLLSHLVLDGLNTYGVRPLLPFSDVKMYGDVASIVDPWMWLGLGTACALGAPAAARSLRGSLGWWAFVALAALAMQSTERVTGALALVWAPAMAAMLVARHRGVAASPGRRRLAARLGIAATAVYLVGLGALNRVADGRARAALLQAAEAADVAPVGSGALETVIHPTVGIPWRFRGIVATPEALYEVPVDLAAGTAGVVGEPFPRHLDHPDLAQVRGTYEHQAWRSFARLPYVARAATGAGPVLVLGDGRYSQQAAADWCNVVAPLDPAPPPE